MDHQAARAEDLVAFVEDPSPETGEQRAEVVGQPSPQGLFEQVQLALTCGLGGHVPMVVPLEDAQGRFDRHDRFSFDKK